MHSYSQDTKVDSVKNKHHFPQSSNDLPSLLSGEINLAARVKSIGFFKKHLLSDVSGAKKLFMSLVYFKLCLL